MLFHLSYKSIFLRDGFLPEETPKMVDGRKKLEESGFYRKKVEETGNYWKKPDETNNLSGLGSDM